MLAIRGEWRSLPVGTYRGRDGGLIHVRRHDDGDLVIETEQESGRFGVAEIASLVKLSDDPYWPDLRPAHAGLASDRSSE